MIFPCERMYKIILKGAVNSHSDVDFAINLAYSYLVGYYNDYNNQQDNCMRD